jgi:transcription initiation factor TFIIB
MNLNCQQVHHDFHVLKNSLGLSQKVIHKAKYIIRHANEKGLVRGRTHTTVVAAAVYIACRETEAPCPLRDIATITNVKRKILARCCRMLMDKLHLNLPTIDPSKCVIRLAEMINANEKAKHLAAVIINEIVKQEISAGKNPMAVAAAVFYISCKKTGCRTSQHSIAKAAGITDVTLRNRFRELKRVMHY